MAAPGGSQAQQLQAQAQALAQAQAQQLQVQAQQLQAQAQAQAQQLQVQAQAQAQAQAQHLQAQVQAQAQQLQAHAQAQEWEPAARVKLLLPQLKDCLQNLMKIAALNFSQNSAIDNGLKCSDSPVQRFDKCLEEFYALCDQIELCLRLSYECMSQSIDSAKHSPSLVPTATKLDATQADSLSYGQYLTMIKSQISCAKDIHTSLLECARRIASGGQM